MLISIQLSSKLSNQKSEEGISENMGGTACVRRSVLLIMMILNIVVLVVQANDPPAPSPSLPLPSSVLTVPGHFPSPCSQQDHTNRNWYDCWLKWMVRCEKITSHPKVLIKLRWGRGTMYKGCVHLIKKLCKVPSDRSAVNRVRFPTKARWFWYEILIYIPSFSLSHSFHFIVYASTHQSIHRHT